MKSAQSDQDTLKILKKNLKDKWWRLNNLYWMLDDKGVPFKFKCNEPQAELFKNLWYRNIILKARQLGFTTFIDLNFLDDAIFTDNLEVAIIAHTKSDATKIFRRKIEYPYAHLPDYIKDNRKLIKDSQEEFVFSNNSVISVTTSARSGTLQRLHISEYGKICAKYPEKAREIATGSIPAVGSDGVIVIESTAEGRAGRFYEMTMAAKRLHEAETDLTPLDYKFFFYAWWQHPRYTLPPEYAARVAFTKDQEEAFEIKQDRIKKELGLDVEFTEGQKAWYVKEEETQREDMPREYPSTPEEAFEQTIEGAYFAKEFREIRQQKRIASIPVEKGLLVHTFWDLGMNDAMSIWFAQIFGREVRLIDYFEASGEGLEFYKQMLDEKGYNYGKHLAPHDIKVRELGSGKTRLQTAADLGVRFEVVPRVEKKIDAINAARSFLSLCWFDEQRCSLGIRRLESYRKEWNENRQCWKDQPLHDENSNCADAFQTGAWGQKLLFGSKTSTAKTIKKKPAGGWT